MKRCPACRRDYYDDSLLYCLDDGSALLEGPASRDEPRTAILHETAPPAEAPTHAQIHTTGGTALLSGAEVEPQKSLNGSTTSPAKIAAKPLAAIVVVAMVSVGGFFGYRYFKADGSGKAEHFKNVKLDRITAEGGVETATISPDGKYIAYSLEESGKRSLWTKHLGSASRVQIVPPVESLSMYASAFSPDGGYVYFTRQDDQNPKGALYTVPVLGGASRKLISDISQPISVSRDGKQIVFGRYKLTNTDDHLMVANSDGTSPRDRSRAGLFGRKCGGMVA
jgi:hypothetical protein